MYRAAIICTFLALFSTCRAQLLPDIYNINKMVETLSIVVNNDTACTTVNCTKLFGKNNELDIMIYEEMKKTGKISNSQFDTLMNRSLKDDTRSPFLLSFKKTYGELLNPKKVIMLKIVKKDSLDNRYFYIHFVFKKKHGFIMIQDDPRKEIEDFMIITDIVINGKSILP
ncbi:MAG: hypothetical protein EG824_06320 [Deltaproteobacteria bacterium]|nr:hypothetical protein [Deltaproteobacteria bacterium]